MIDLTPLDVRNKRGDFKKILRGYDPQDVDTFLELVAERLEALVRENLQLRERSELLQQQVSSSTGRERAVQEALVTAQELRADIRAQAQREADLILQQARADARQQATDAEYKIDVLNDSLAELERRRTRFLKAFRQLLERELDGVEVEEARAPLEEQAIELNLGRRRDEEEDTVEDGGAGPPGKAPQAGASAASAIPDEGAGPEPQDVSVPWDAPVHDLARAHPRDESTGASGNVRREGDLFSLPDLPRPGDADGPAGRG
jgi:cell division initiation protein